MTCCSAGVGKAAALREAQLWLRDLTAAQAQEILEAAGSGGGAADAGRWR
jgi:hypothetical protein